MISIQTTSLTNSLPSKNQPTQPTNLIPTTASPNSSASAPQSTIPNNPTNPTRPTRPQPATNQSLPSTPTTRWVPKKQFCRSEPIPFSDTSIRSPPKTSRQTSPALS